MHLKMSAKCQQFCLNLSILITSIPLLSAGLRQCARGGGIGFGLAAVYCLFTSRDRLKQMAGMD